jgi:peptidoglycan/xylan/chitin deacetylase (PgdA/CDA1 family)
MRQQRSCILTYHSLDDSGSVVSIPPAMFREQMAWLAGSGVPVVPLERVRDTPGAVALTFDDGFRNFFEHAAPVLQQHRLPATVFAVSGFCDGSNDWPSQPRNGIPRLELMRWHELEQVARCGISIGCHTATHPYLSKLSAKQIEDEFAASRSEIEQRIGKEVRTFAYPYGDSNPQVRAAASRFFHIACGTRMSFLSADSDMLDLPRLDVYYLRNSLWFHGLTKLYGAVYLAGRTLLRDVRQRLTS